MLRRIAEKGQLKLRLISIKLTEFLFLNADNCFNNHSLVYLLGQPSPVPFEVNVFTTTLPPSYSTFHPTAH